MDSRAQRLHEAMVTRLVRAGTVSAGPVEAALRAVPRHLFVPQVTLRQAYADIAVVTRRADDGTPLSSVSQPTMVAIMLTQLQVRPGDRVLEVGAGGGYNAALLDELAEPHGSVTTIDIEPEVAAEARDALTRSGHDRVRVVTGDGAEGCADGAPYDRLIVTAAVDDLARAWEEQLTTTARIVVPLTVCGSTRNVALARTDDGWRSESAGVCGFIALRGAQVAPARRLVIDEHATVQLEGATSDEHGVLDEHDAREGLRGPAVTRWTGVTLGAADSVEDLQLYLALTGPGAYGRIVASDRPQRPLGDGRIVAGAGGFAYPVARPAPDDTTEIGVVAYGRDAERLAATTAGHVVDWFRQHRTAMAQLSLTVASSDAAPLTPPPGHLITTRYHRLYVSWPGWAKH